MRIQAPKGTFDMLPSKAHRWHRLEADVHRLCALSGYREIRTPVFEHTELFLRGVGDTTDVVQKEMYTFKDKGDRSITLKPEGTAGVVRAFLEANLYAEPMPTKLYYVNCPVFRYDKPQAGRMREHHQIGVEIFGAKDASCDAEIIKTALNIIEGAGVSGLRLMINSIGCKECRKTYFEELATYLSPKLDSLCETCRGRFSRNPMRILDCKVPSCQAQLTDAPSMLNHLCEDCAAHFEKLKAYLGALDIRYTVDPRVVRGLDYYTKTVFEVVTDIGSGELAVCGGGRYDGLVEQLGGPATPGIGFGMGIERLLMVQEARSAAPEEPPLLGAFIATLGEEARIEGLKLAYELRERGVKADIDHAARSLKAQFKYADKLGVPTVLILAEDELKAGVVKVRDMANATEETVARGEVTARLAAAAGV